MAEGEAIKVNPETKEEKKFTFDYSYWSHDSFDTLPDGVMVPVDERYADQRRVFCDLGQGVLDNAFQGFNTSLFAYGQTGSGKSYSMVGYGNNRGIVPISCDELFKKIDLLAQTADKNKTRNQIVLSMLEVYNEQVRDLLSKDQNVKGGLPVRQNATQGRFFVQGLKRVPVASYVEIERRIAEGTANRTLAATKMNATSSRAHTVVTILFEQIHKNDDGKETTKSSEINLVDLAGSERADSTGATGDTLKEGSMINLSLSCLGNVISALAENCSGKKKILVPYRDSVLTKLLANALGGNSKTIMIAALSPADINYDETLSTLRYADRAKQIKNKAIINESPTDKLIRMLKEENERLKKQLESGGVITVVEGSQKGMSEDEIAALRRKMEEEIRAQLEANMQDLKKETNWAEVQNVAAQETKAEEKEEAEKLRKIASLPHFVNLNEDPMLSGVVYHFLEKPTIVIGKADSNKEPDISLSGLSIRKEHAIIEMRSNKGGKAEIKMRAGTLIAKTKINGLALGEEQVLRHKDRVLFGSNHLYVFYNPKDQTPSAGSPEDAVTYDFAQNEIAHAKGYETNVHGLTPDQIRAQEQILELLPMVSEANAISEELNKQRGFEIALFSGKSFGSKEASTTVMVKMRNLINSNEHLWSRGKFMDKRYQFQAMYQEWSESQGSEADKYVGVPVDSKDPFYELPEDLLLGSCTVFLESLGYCLDLDDTFPIVDYRGEEQGRLALRVTPCNKDGDPVAEDDTVDDPAALLNTPYHVVVEIVSANVHKARFSHGLRCEYQFFGQKAKTETPTLKGLPVTFNHKTRFDFSKVSPEMIEWFEGGSLHIEVFAKQIDTATDAKLVSLTTREIRRLDETRTGHSTTDMQPHRASVAVAVAAPSANDSLGPPRGPHLGRGSVAVAEAAAAAAEEEAQSSKAQIAQLDKKLGRATKKEAKIKELMDLWRAKPKDDQDFDGLLHDITAALEGRTTDFLVHAPSKPKPVPATTTTTTAPSSDHNNNNNSNNSTNSNGTRDSTPPKLAPVQSQSVTASTPVKSSTCLVM